MKKGLQLSAAAVLALSAITPVVASAAETETTTVTTGIYSKDGFTSIPNFKKLSNAAKVALLGKEDAVLVIGTDVVRTEVILKGTDADISAKTVSVDKYQKDNNVTFDPDKGIVVGNIGELKVESVSAINATTIEVTFNKALTSADPSNFNIAGLQISGASFKPETDKKVVVLTTNNQEVQEYTLNYENGSIKASKKFIGKASLGTVLLKTETNKYEYEIDPNLNVLPTVEITAELSEDFPKNAEAVIEFETSFGQVVKVQTTKNGKTTFTLTPEKTLFSQTARVTGRVVEVKNPNTGESYPEFRNASVQTINVKFNIKPGNDPGKIEVYNFGTAYAEQADRIALLIEGSDTANLEKSIQNSPQHKIAALGNGVVAQQNLSNTDLVKKELYTHLHDVMFSNISKIVEKANTSYDAGNSEFTKSEVLKQAETELNKFFNKLEAQDLRNALYADTIGVSTAPTGTNQPNYDTYDKNRYAEVYRDLVENKPADLKVIVESISIEELNDILSYYKLLSKFIVLDNVRDVELPQSPDKILAVESLYLEQKGNEKSVVLVLPTDRSTKARDISSRLDSENGRYDQRKGTNVVREASHLTDNVSHQVVFLNNIEKDRYQLTGAPAFKLEDSNDVKLISVTTDDMRYKVQPSTPVNNPEPEPKPDSKTYCPIPFSVDVEESNLGGGTETGGGTVDLPGTKIHPYFVKDDKTLFADDYTISDYFMKAEFANKANTKADKLGEVLVVFSESVSLKGANSVLDAKNWSIDGKNLADAAREADAQVHIRLASTDVSKQLRDAVIVTFTSDLDNNDKVVNTELVDKFVEAYHEDNHKLEVSKIADWAGVTDSKNIVPTQTLDYASATNATEWAQPFYKAGSNTGSNDVPKEDGKVTHVGIEGSNAFVVRAAAQADVTKGININAVEDTKDIVRILFSEPMQITGPNSVLNKEAYKINGAKLPVDGTSINFGLKGVEGMENSLCAVTIELPNGTLQNNNLALNGNENIIAVSNVRGKDDTTTFVSDLQLAFARNLTLVSDKATIGYNNGSFFNKDGQVDFKLNNIAPGTLTNVTKVEGRVYVDKDGNAIKFSNTWVDSAAFFTTHVNGTTTDPGNGNNNTLPKVSKFNFSTALPGFGQGTVVVTLDTDTPNNYTVTVKGTELKYDAELGAFKGILPGTSNDAYNVSDVVVKKVEAPALPEIKKFNFSTALPGFGQGTVVVTLDTETPNNYKVTVKGTELTYDAELGAFKGILPGTSNDAYNKADAVVTVK